MEQTTNKQALSTQISRMKKVAQAMMDRGDTDGQKFVDVILDLERTTGLRRKANVKAPKVRVTKPGVYNHRLAYEGFPGLATTGLGDTPNVDASNGIDMQLNMAEPAGNQDTGVAPPEIGMQENEGPGPGENSGHPDIEPFVEMHSQTPNNAPSSEIHTAEVTFEAKENFPADTVMEKMTGLCKELGVKITGFVWKVREAKETKVAVR